jgi:RNA polymerase sigma-70 factor (ECF subfamily)
MDSKDMKEADQFETLVSEHYESLFRFAMSLTRSESDARDLTQQTFYIWATKGHQVRDLSKVKAWLFTTLHRTFLLARRRHSKFTDQNLDELSNELPSIDPDFIARGDSSQALIALGMVDEVFQAPVALFYLEDYSYKEIATILSVPLGTVKSRLARGVEQLRRILASDVASDQIGTTECVLNALPRNGT